MKYVEWIEPYGSGNEPVICRMSLKHILKIQIDKNPLYGSFSERAIKDFIVIHWGSIKEYEKPISILK